MKLLSKNMQGLATGPDEFVLARKDGKKISVEIFTYPVKINNTDYVLGIARDITEKKLAQKQAQSSEEKFKTIFNSANDCILIYDLAGNILEINDLACKRFGFSRAEIQNKSFFDTYISDNFEILNEKKDELLKKGKLVFEAEAILKNGKISPVEISARIINYKGSKATLCISRDISERKKIEELLKELAYKDPLTDLPNRSLVAEHFKIIKANTERNKEKFAIMMSDIDKFKTVNDTFGHGLGDELLKQIGRRFLSILRKEDIVARIGGDEFLLLIPEIKGVEDIEIVAKKLITGFQQKFVIHNHAIRTTLSIGISIFPTHGNTFDILVKKADTAMYQVKKESRNGFKIVAF